MPYLVRALIIHRDVGTREFIRNFLSLLTSTTGKSTWRPRLLETTGALTKREMMEQVLDSMDLERRGIHHQRPIPVDLNYRSDDGADYQLNLSYAGPSISRTSFRPACQAARARCWCRRVAGSGGRKRFANTYLSLHHIWNSLPVHQQDRSAFAPSPSGFREQIEALIGLDAKDAVLVRRQPGRPASRGAVGRSSIWCSAPSCRPTRRSKALVFRFVVSISYLRRDQPSPRHRVGTLISGIRSRIWSTGRPTMSEGL